MFGSLKRVIELEGTQAKNLRPMCIIMENDSGTLSLFCPMVGSV